MIAFRHFVPADGSGRAGTDPGGRLAVAAALVAASVTAIGATPAMALDTTDTGDTGELPLCLYVSSYHRGYDWSDGVERGLRASLAGVCDIEQFDMDTKRRRAPGQIAAAADQARQMVERLQPDIVITSDDNAAKHFIVPFLSDGSVPVVFSGINWTVEEYGLPTSNVTGIVEVAPIAPMIREAMTLVPGATRVAYLGAATLTEQKNFERIEQFAVERGVVVDGVLVEDLEAWKGAFDDAQNYDFVVIGSHSGIDDWDIALAAEHAQANTRRPSLTNNEWMMPVTAIGYTKLPEEHGERAGETARAILSGTAPADIPLVVNRMWDTWLNLALVERLDMAVPERLRQRSKQIESRP